MRCAPGASASTRVRTVYIGTSGFALDGARAPRALRPALVVTRPPAPRGRGRRVEPSPVARAARASRARGARARAPRGRSPARSPRSRPTWSCLCAYGALVREPLLSRHEILGVHPSLLPRWRGAAPIERAIMAGDERTGVSIMRLVAELDAGPVCAVGERRRSRPDDDYGSLSARLAPLARRAARERGRRPARVRRPGRATASPTPRRSPRPTACSIPARPAVELERVVRALHPHIGARLAERPRRARGARACAAPPGARPGALARAEDGRLYLGATPRGARARPRRSPAGADGAMDARPCPLTLRGACPSERAAGGRPARRRRRAHVLRRTFEQGAFTDRAFIAAARGLDARDRALAMHLAYGAVQRALTLDHLIEHVAGRPMRAHRRAAARGAAPGLLRALLRRQRRARRRSTTPSSSPRPAHGHALVNAVLRRIARERDGAARERSATATRRRRRSRHSMPQWIVERWWEALGAGAAPARCWRASTSRPRARCAPTRCATDARRRWSRRSACASRPWSRRAAGGGHRARALRRPRLAAVARGRADAAVARVDARRARARPAARRARARPLRRPGRQDDAPRGADGRRAARSSRSSATPAARGRCSAPRSGWAPRNVTVEVGDATRPRRRRRALRRACCSTPRARASGRSSRDPTCAGARRADARRRPSPSEQARLLSAAAAACAPGGTLVYSTCTISAAENERQIGAFLDAHPEFAAIDLQARFPAWAHPVAPGAAAGARRTSRAATGSSSPRSRRAGD